MKAEVFEEVFSGSVGHGAADDFGSASLLDQLSLQQSLDNAVDGDAANLLGFCAGKGLAVGDDGQGFEGGLGEFGRAGFLPDERANPRGVFASGDELPGAGDADQSVAAAGLFVFFGQLFQCLADAFGAGLDERFVLANFFELFGSRAAKVAQFGRRQRFLRGEEDRFYGKTQVHRSFRRVLSPVAALRRLRLSPPSCLRCFPNRRIVPARFLRRVFVGRPE